MPSKRQSRACARAEEEPSEDGAIGEDGALAFCGQLIASPPQGKCVARHANTAARKKRGQLVAQRWETTSMIGIRLGQQTFSECSRATWRASRDPLGLIHKKTKSFL